MKIVSKGWGFEKWIVNNEKYCGKLLYIIKDKKCSLHYHKLKDETFYCSKGRILLKYGHITNTARLTEVVLSRGDSFHIPPFLCHQMIGLEDSELFEFSTQHFDEDSYRIAKGD